MESAAADANGGLPGWLATLDLIQRDNGLLFLHKVSTPPLASEGRQPTAKSDHVHPVGQECEHTNNPLGDDAEHDLEIDLARAALDAGQTAFAARDWDEANALLQEALQILYQLPAQQRGFCDIFSLHYQLAVCAFHSQACGDAEQALGSLSRLPASSDEHRGQQYDAAYLLSHLYIHRGQLDRAKHECERALQGRRRLLGKQAEPSLEATALMAHIWLSLNNRARAKAYSGMIPDGQREAVTRTVEASLGARLKEADAASILSQPVSDAFEFPVQPSPSASSVEFVDPSGTVDHCYRPGSITTPPSLSASPRPSYHVSQSAMPRLQSTRSVTAPSVVTRQERRPPQYSEMQMPYERHSVSGAQSSTSVEKPRHVAPASTDHRITAVTPTKTQKPPAHSKTKSLSRTEVLRNIHCTPVDRIEEAVCASNHTLLAALLKKRSSSWGAKVRAAMHSKRVSALHFATVFGEIEMADRLLDANFDINEVPELSATRQTPLKFALGARQVEMVEFLLARGAKPIQPDTWATTIGLVMDRSWLNNTMSTADREDLHQAPDRIVAILGIWTRYGWDVNAPYDEVSGRTLLHRTVAFETGFYKWDANLRVKITRFLCERGADPRRADKKGNTPYDMATVAEDHELLQVFNQMAKSKAAEERVAGLIELSANPFDPVELFGSTTPAKIRG